MKILILLSVKLKLGRPFQLKLFYDLQTNTVHLCTTEPPEFPRPELPLCLRESMEWHRGCHGAPSKSKSRHLLLWFFQNLYHWKLGTKYPLLLWELVFRVCPGKISVFWQSLCSPRTVPIIPFKIPKCLLLWALPEPSMAREHLLSNAPFRQSCS